MTQETAAAMVADVEAYSVRQRCYLLCWWPACQLCFRTAVLFLCCVNSLISLKTHCSFEEFEGTRENLPGNCQRLFSVFVSKFDNKLLMLLLRM